jgi:TM2 domain-containing membrane protein YozV
MKLLKITTLIIVVLISFNTSANDIPIKKSKLFSKIKFLKKADNKHSKIIAASLDLSLGMFGVHRLYLGTKPIVPMIYAITLGGGGFLVIIDMGIILFSNDIEKYSNNNSIFMWNKQ